MVRTYLCSKYVIMPRRCRKPKHKINNDPDIKYMIVGTVKYYSVLISILNSYYSIIDYGGNGIDDEEMGLEICVYTIRKLQLDVDNKMCIFDFVSFKTSLEDKIIACIFTDNG